MTIFSNPMVICSCFLFFCVKQTIMRPKTGVNTETKKTMYLHCKFKVKCCFEGVAQLLTSTSCVWGSWGFKLADQSNSMLDDI